MQGINNPTLLNSFYMSKRNQSHSHFQTPSKAHNHTISPIESPEASPSQFLKDEKIGNLIYKQKKSSNASTGTNFRPQRPSSRAKVQSSVNRISDFYNKRQIVSAINGMDSVDERIRMVDSILKRREEMQHAEQQLMLERAAPMIKRYTENFKKRLERRKQRAKYPHLALSQENSQNVSQQQSDDTNEPSRPNSPDNYFQIKRSTKDARVRRTILKQATQQKYMASTLELDSDALHQVSTFDLSNSKAQLLGSQTIQHSNNNGTLDDIPDISDKPSRGHAFQNVNEKRKTLVAHMFQDRHSPTKNKSIVIGLDENDKDAVHPVAIVTSPQGTSQTLIKNQQMLRNITTPTLNMRPISKQTNTRPTPSRASKDLSSLLNVNVRLKSGPSKSSFDLAGKVLEKDIYRFMVKNGQQHQSAVVNFVETQTKAPSDIDSEMKKIEENAKKNFSSFVQKQHTQNVIAQINSRKAQTPSAQHRQTKSSGGPRPILQIRAPLNQPKALPRTSSMASPKRSLIRIPSSQVTSPIHKIKSPSVQFNGHQPVRAGDESFASYTETMLDNLYKSAKHHQKNVDQLDMMHERAYRKEERAMVNHLVSKNIHDLTKDIKNIVNITKKKVRC